jgi:Dihaem cytochrome c
MKTRRQGLAALALAAAAAVVGGGAMPGAPAFAASGRVLVPADSAYLKECGTCHSAFSPELLPAASWRRMMQRLEDHFGESAKLDAVTQRRLTDYLVANAADRATNGQSRAIMGSLRPGETPLRITQVPYIAGLHAAVLDPLWNGTPRPKTLTECGVCHNGVKSGDFNSRVFHVNDELFRGSNPRAQ